MAFGIEGMIHAFNSRCNFGTYHQFHRREHSMLTLRSVLTVGLIVFLSSGTASATVFTPTLDEFWVVKDGNEVFRDSFDDGVPPPSGPDDGIVFPTTYSVFGEDGFTSEAAGKLTMTPSLGGPVAITTTFADLFTGGLRLRSTNPDDPAFLGFNDQFAIQGLYDMSSLPSIAGQTFGIRVSDRALGLGNLGNNTLTLGVGIRPSTGDLVVGLRLLDFANNTTTLLGFDPIQSLVAGADQIELLLEKAVNSAIVSASYVIYDAASNVLGAGTVGTGTIYDGESYIRPQFYSTDRVFLAVPVPATLMLLSLGFLGVVYSRRFRTAAV